MSVGTSPERDTSLDGTLADLLITGELQRNMKSIFPRRWIRIRAYGKLIVAPIIRYPLRHMSPAGFIGDKGKQVSEKIAKESLDWTLKGDRCSPEARANLEAGLLIESAFEDMPEPQ
jgi:hypothetical protein